MVTLSEDEIQVVRAALEFIGDGNIGFEALEGYTDLEDEELWEVAQGLLKRI